MLSLIYCPASLWEVHESQVVDIAWEEYRKGNVVTMLKCNKFFSSCPTNLKKDRWRCIDCVKQSKYTSRNLLPPGSKTIWLKPLKKYYSTELETAIDEVKLRNLHEFSYDGCSFGFSVLSHLITMEQDIFPSGLQCRNLAKLLLRESIEFYHQALGILDTGVEKVFVWGGRRMSEAPLIFAAKKKGIPIEYFELGYRPKTYFLSKNGVFTFTGMLDEVQKWILEREKAASYDARVREGESFFIDWMAGRSAQPHFKWHLEGYKKKPVLEPVSTKKLLLVCTSSLWESFAYQDYKALINPDFFDPYKLTERICLDEKITNKYEIIVRWHPNLRRAGANEQKRMKDIILKTSNVVHIKPEQTINSYDLVKMSDVVVSFGSTIGVESTVLGKPSILLGLSSYMNLESVYQPSDYLGFQQLISTEPSPKNTEGAFLWGDWMKNFGMEFKFIKERKGHFWIHNRRVQRRSARIMFRSKWFASKHKIKKFFVLMN